MTVRWGQPASASVPSDFCVPMSAQHLISLAADNFHSYSQALQMWGLVYGDLVLIFTGRLSAKIWFPFFHILGGIVQ